MAEVNLKEELKQKEVRDLLNNYSKVGSAANMPHNKDGSLNIDRCLEVPEFKALVDKLKELKITTDWLFDNGYMPAALLLGKFLK